MRTKLPIKKKPHCQFSLCLFKAPCKIHNSGCTQVVFTAKQTLSLLLILKMILAKPEMLQTHRDYMMSENL